MISKKLSYPIAIELDSQTWKEWMDSIEIALGNLLMIQTDFCQLVEDAICKINEPHIGQHMSQISAAARQHGTKVDELYSLIGRDSSQARRVVGPVQPKTFEALPTEIKDFRRLILYNIDSLGAFSIVEQLGLALGIPAIPEMIVPIVKEKYEHHLLLQEFLLEIATKSILYKSIETDLSKSRMVPPEAETKAG